jgi:hypothetical protein
VPDGQKAAIFQPRNIAATAQNVTDRSKLKFVYLTGNHNTTESSRLDSRLEKIEKSNTRLPKKGY